MGLALLLVEGRSALLTQQSVPLRLLRLDCLALCRLFHHCSLLLLQLLLLPSFLRYVLLRLVSPRLLKLLTLRVELLLARLQRAGFCAGGGTAVKPALMKIGEAGRQALPLQCLPLTLLLLLSICIGDGLVLLE